MSTFLLVHARWHGAWCWDKVAARLRDAGHLVVTPDRAELDRLRDLLEAQPEPVVLTGHSSSGMTISALAELVPHQVRLLVYISAFLLPNGMIPPDIGRADSESILHDHLAVDQERQMVTVSEPEKVFFADCDPAEARWAASMLTPEPVTVPAGPTVTLTDERFGQVPRVYVECLDDRALGPSAQRRMYTTTPCERVYQLPTGHSPFLAAPDLLAADLLDAAASIARR